MMTSKILQKIQQAKKKPTAEVAPINRWDSAGKTIDLLQKLIVFTGTIFGIIVIALFFVVNQKQSIVIGKFSIAEDVKKMGYDEVAIARQLSDKIRALSQQTKSQKDYRASYSYDNEPLIQVEERNFTAKSINEFIERLFAKRRYVVTGEVTHVITRDISVVVRIDDYGYHVVSTPVSDINDALDKEAEYILYLLEPYIYAAFLLTNGRNDDALKMIQYCLSSMPINSMHWVYNLWGVYFLENGQYEQAIEKFRASIKRNNEFSIAYLNWALALEYQNKVQESLKMYQQAAKYKRSADALGGQGRMLIRLDRPNEAIEILKEAEFLQPQQRGINIDLANAYIKSDQLDKALSQIEFARELGPSDIHIETLYAAVLDGLGDHARAIEVYRDILNQNKTFWLVRNRLDELTRHSGDEK